MTPIQRFHARLESAGGGAFVTIPFDVEQVFGAKRVPVKATIDGEPYRGSLVRMGGPDHMLIVLKEIREKIGKGPGDEVEVTVEKDDEPRVVQPPPELAAALAADPDAAAHFERLAYSHRREYVKWIEEAKRPETRAGRVGKAVAMLRDGRKLK
jgi:bifunctional DNA-binding transcriptional regulator/antitoxin component of YhaV-PrlF toxin-antitoxin module